MRGNRTSGTKGRGFPFYSIDALERRVHLSATVEYRPQKPDGTLETPVIATTRQPVQDFTPEQLSILQRGFTESQHDLFLKLTNIQGESNDDRHPGEIELVSFSWGENATHASSAGQVTVGASRFHEVHVVKRMSKASPKLLQAMTDGTIIADGSLVVGKPGDKPLDFLRLDLKNVRVSSYQLRPATDGSNALLEEFTLSFGQVAMEYRSQKADGTLDSPVVFQGQAPVEDFAPQQRSLLDDGIVNASGLSQFLTIDGILGESQDIAHRDAIDVRTFRWGGDQAFALGGGGATIGRVTLHELHVVANVSKASPNLMGRMSTGTVIPTATLAVAHPSGAGDFYKLTLTNALVSSYRVTAGPAGELLEEFTLAFTGTRAEYSAPLPNGKLDSPVVFQGAQVAVQDFDPPQTSELHDGSLIDGSLDLFLQLDGIPGESTDARHPNEIELVSFGWGGDLTYGSSGGSTGVSSLHELRVVMPITKATPKLMQAIANGTHIPTAKLSVQRLAGRGGGDVYSIALENLVVSSHQLTTAANGRLMEEVSLAFSKVELTYRPQKADGSLDTPVVFQRTGAPVEAYAAEQRALLDEGHVPLSGLDAFLRVDGILGESMDVDHKDQIDVLSFEWGADHAFALGGGGGGVGRTQFHELHVVSHVSRASPKLMEAMVQGKAIAAADLFVRKAGDNPQEFFKLTLENVIVSSYQVKPSPRGEMLEEYTLSFNEARVEYRAQKADGSLEPPVVFQQAVTNVEDFEPEQLALIDRELGVLPHDIVLRLPGIPGESTLNGYAGQIDVESFSWGGDARLGLIGGGEVGAPELRELHLVSRVSKASPKLIDALAKGTQLADAELSFVATATRGERFMRITLKDVLVSSYQTTTDNNGTLMEEVTLLFLDSEWEYRRLQSNGSVGTPVIFAAQRIPVEDFAPTQRSILPGARLIPTLQAFIEIDGIPGESTDSAHEDEIDVLSFSWGADATFGTGGGGGIPVGRSQFHEVHFVARTSRATPRLLDRLTQGKHVADARLVLRKGGVKPAEFFTITLADVVVSSYQVTTAEDGYLLEEITLAYGPGDAEPPTAVTLTGTAGADTFYLRRSGTGIAVFNNDTGTGTPIQIVGAGQGILVNTLAGDDRLIIDQSAGDLVVPNGIQFTGGDGVDTLRIINATGNAAINEQGVTTVGNTQVNHGAIENVELNGILIGLLLPAVQTLKVAGNDGLITVQDLNLGAGARLDLGTNDLRILGSDVASIEELMKTARNGAAPWQGPGIGTSAATALTGLAAVQQGPDVLVRFTYNGDANVDGRINADDYFLIDSGFLERPANPPYARGDFNFDDAINADDYFLIDSAFLGQAQPLGEASSGSIPTSATLQPAVAPAAPFYSADARNHVKRRARARFSDTVISSTGRAETHARKLVAPTRGN